MKKSKIVSENIGMNEIDLITANIENEFIKFVNFANSQYKYLAIKFDNKHFSKEFSKIPNIKQEQIESLKNLQFQYESYFPLTSQVLEIFDN